MTKQELMERFQFYQIKIVVGGGAHTLYRSNLVLGGFKYTAGVQTSGGYGPGGAEAQSLSFVVINRDGALYGAFKRGTKIELYAGFGETATGAAYEKIATLYVESCSRSMNALTVVAYDSLHYTGDRTAWEPVSFPSNVGAIISSAVQQMGVTLASSSFAGSDIPVDLRDEDGKQPALDITVRQAIAEACLISGNFARIDKDGHAVIGWFPSYMSDPDITIPHYWIKDYTFSDDEVMYTAVKVGDLDIYGTTGDLPVIGAAPEYDPPKTGVYYLQDATFLTADNAEAVRNRLYAALCSDARVLYSASITTAGNFDIRPGMQVDSTYYGATGEPSQPRLMFPRTIPVCGLTWDGSMDITLTCPTGDAANADDLRPKAGDEQIRQTIRQELRNPKSELSQAITSAAGDEGGGGGSGADSGWTGITVDQAYATYRPAEWPKMPDPYGNEIYLLQDAPYGVKCPLAMTIQAANEDDGYMGVIQVQVGTTGDDGDFIPQSTYLYDARDEELDNRSGFEFEELLPGGTKIIRISASTEITNFAAKEFAAFGQSADTDYNIVEIAGNLPSARIQIRGFTQTRFLYLPGMKMATWSEIGMTYMPHLTVVRAVSCDCGTTAMPSFTGLHELVAARIINVDKSNCNANNMFDTCRSLLVAEMDYTAIKSSQHMFQNCKSLPGIGALAMPECTNAAYMFSGCTGIKAFDSITLADGANMSYMFNTCSGLVRAGRIDTHEPSNMTRIFYGCTALENVPDVRRWGTSMTYAFGSCENLYDVGDMDMPGVEVCANMFSGCDTLLHVGSLYMPDIYGTNGAGAMFSGCVRLESVGDIEIGSGRAAGDAVSVMHMFSGCVRLKSIGSLDVTHVSVAQGMFQNCAAITEIGDIALQDGANASQMFAGCTSLRAVGDISVDGVASSMSGMFSGCTRLSSVGNVVSGAVTMTSMFADCYELAEIGSIDTSHATNMNQMFQNTALYENPGIDMSAATSAGSIFNNCKNLTDGGEISNEATPTTGTTNWDPFTNCPRLTSVRIAPGSHFLRNGLTMANHLMSREALIELFNSLPDADMSGGTGPSLIVYGNPGVLELTEEDMAIATGKGYVLRTV